jgi:RNA polymerase sigma factor (sigma-70 family)
MDGYAYVLEQLRREDFRRLRRFQPHGASTFSTWLVVVARRLCVDFYRQRYGRTGETERSSVSHERDTRRQLEDLVSDSAEVTDIADSSRATLTREYVVQESQRALDAVVRSLEPGDQLLLRLRFSDGLTVREIADALGSDSQMAVYRRIQALLATLRARLEEVGVEGTYES